MTTATKYQINPKLDLVLERVVDVPREKIFEAWTTPKLLMPWFCPKPWQVVDCEIDLRPGGLFSTTMQSPEGEKFPNVGCYLEIVKNEKLVWTSALLPDFRPAPPVPAGESKGCDFPFTAMLLLEAHGNGTKYTAIGMHGTEESRKKHEEMGFEQGWGICLDQLVAQIKGV